MTIDGLVEVAKIAGSYSIGMIVGGWLTVKYMKQQTGEKP